jgi:Rhodopirellula transposase DDE domain
MKDATAGDPISGLKWSRKALRKISWELRHRGRRISAPTISRLLIQDRYSLRVNAKRLTGRKTAVRNLQFTYLVRQRRLFLSRGWPVISVDSKKRELVGPFKNSGRTWRRFARSVNMYDFPSDAVGIAVLYGVYDVGRNLGFVGVGVAHDTSEFAVATIRTWWFQIGRRAHAGQRHLLLQADGGGSNGYRERLWKLRLQEFADEANLIITVTHYPTGASKWNLIEHRMFSAISANWAGQPLDSYETILKYIRTTTTDSGFRCRAHLNTTPYRTGVKVSDEQFRRLRLRPRKVLPQWNYSLYPRIRPDGEPRW